MILTPPTTQKHPGAEVLFPHSKVYPQLHPALPLFVFVAVPSFIAFFVCRGLR